MTDYVLYILYYSNFSFILEAYMPVATNAAKRNEIHVSKGYLFSRIFQVQATVRDTYGPITIDALFMFTCHAFFFVKSILLPSNKIILNI